MGEGNKTSIRIVGLVAVLGLVATACGARLTDEQRQAGIGSLAGGTATGPGSDLGDPGSDLGDPGSDLGDPGSDLGSGTDLGGPAGGAQDAGPLTASDVGVTPTKITIATIADISGVQPGLFKSAHQAMQALAAMVNAEGGILGRELEVMYLDSKVDAGATRNAVLEACDKAFALVGNMSAFENGGAKAVDDCGIPDMSAITVTPERHNADMAYPIFPNGGGAFIQASARMMKEQHPDTIEKAAQLWLNTSTTRTNASNKRNAYEDVGFDFVYTAETQVVEANYSPFVQKMKDAGVEFVTMLSDFQSIVRLLKAMDKQSFRPEVMEWDSVVYSPKFLEEAQGTAEGSLVYLNSAMVEEIDQNPEMQLYAQWLSRVAPGVQPDYFGLYAWSAGRLFVELALTIGADLTRDALIGELKKVTSWDGNGLHAPHNVGGKVPSKCIMYVRVENDRFVRHFPAKGFACNKGGLYFN